MKNKVFILLILILFFLVGCTNESESEDDMKSNQNIDIIEKGNDGEILKGVLEGYTFTETSDVTDRVKLQMESGEVILIVLSNSSTPVTINNFKKLVSEHFYDGLIFHRVIKDFMIQGGDPTGTGMGGSDEKIKGEFKQNGVDNSMSHTRGVISMARSQDMNSASSQFFIVHQNSPHLDGSYAAFGRVFAGIDIVDQIAEVETDSSDRPIDEQTIKSIRFIEVDKAREFLD